MKVAVLGTGVVGESIASALADQENFVMMGSRTGNNEKATAWMKKSGKYASAGSFNEAAVFADIIFICLKGEHALDVAKGLNEHAVHNKIVVDITNPLDFTKG